MKTRLILKPGQRGTKRLTDKYGTDLVCVRFRYDTASKQRLKTVELVIERTDWQPPPEKLSAETIVAVKIEGYETGLRKSIKRQAANGNRNRNSGMSATEKSRAHRSKSIYM